MTKHAIPLDQFDPYLFGEVQDLEVPDEIPRDQYGRPLIAPIGVDPATCIKPPRNPDKRIKGQNYFIPYTRSSTMAKALDDQTAIEGWRSRMSSLGVAMSNGLQASFLAIDDISSKEGKKEADELVESAMEVSGANERRRRGSGIHKYTERFDKGLPLGNLGEHARDVAAYVESTHGCEMQHIERFTVNDRDEIAGTPDRLCDGKISDVKTGNDVLQYAQLSIAMQLASYADSEFYNPVTGERTAFVCDPNEGIVWHLPAGEARCVWYSVDLNVGREGITVAKSVRNMRKVKGVFTEIRNEPNDLFIHELIDLAPNRDRLVEAWTLFQRSWTDEHTEHATVRIAELAAELPAQDLQPPF